jgi:putative peptidoglycan lipid II flippase
LLYNLSIIAGAWFLAPEYGVYGLVACVIVGAGLHLDSQLFGLWWFRARYYGVLGLKNSRVREVGRLMGPRVLGLAAVQINFWINTLLASQLPAGSISAAPPAFDAAPRIVAQAVATAASRHSLRCKRGGAPGAHPAPLALSYLTLPAAVGLSCGASFIRMPQRASSRQPRPK